MTKLLIEGGKPLEGRVRVSGRKNSAVAVLPAALLAPGVSYLENIPNIADVQLFMRILRYLGADVEWQDGNTVRVDASQLTGVEAPAGPVQKMRASYYLLGALVARCGEAKVALPGGCDIGPRPVDQHLKGFRALGCEVSVEHGVVHLRAQQLVGARIYLDVVSVGATINIMLAASRAEGTTVIENAAKEPHVVDVANYLNAMGARVVGAGTDMIKVNGARELHGTSHAIVPDEIEAATFMMAAAGTLGDVVIENVIPKHLEPIVAKLREAGATVQLNGDWVRVAAGHRLRAVDIKTLPYPGFPTDAQQPTTVLLSVAEGSSTITETIWEGRFKHVDELKRMGANIRVEGRTAIINGVPALSGAAVHATDLRAGAGLVVAGCIAEGQTEITGVAHIDRGYEKLDEKFAQIGALIRRVEE